jgi:hypothetical protein
LLFDIVAFTAGSHGTGVFMCVAIDSRNQSRSGSLSTGLVLVVWMITGCSSSGLPDMVPIRGEVLYNGEPLKEGNVVYLPTKAGQGRQATGAIQADGSFVMTTLKEADGVMQGEYNLVIYAYEPHPGEPKSREEHEALAESCEILRGFLIPEKYTSPNTSGLSDRVDGDHSGFKRIELRD